MTTELEIGLYIFILAGFLGYHVITRVPPLLHTPLMSATNAISGISLIGSLVIAGNSRDGVGGGDQGRVQQGRDPPLMSATNAISGISLIGSLVIAEIPEM